MVFTDKTKKWDAKLTGEEHWEKQMSDLTSVFIPAKEILSNAWNLESAVKMGNVEFDDTYLDIIAAAKVDISKGSESAERKKYLNLLQKISTGKEAFSDERFYLKPGAQAKLEFNLVAENCFDLAVDKKRHIGTGLHSILGRARSKYQPQIYTGSGRTSYAVTAGRCSDFYFYA